MTNEERQYLVLNSPFEIRNSKFEIHSAPPPAAISSIALLISSCSSFPGLKDGIFFDGTSAFSPVLGLRPVRDLRLRRRKLPKPRSSIFCPERGGSTMEAKKMV